MTGYTSSNLRRSRMMIGLYNCHRSRNFRFQWCYYLPDTTRRCRSCHNSLSPPDSPWHRHYHCLCHQHIGLYQRLWTSHSSCRSSTGLKYSYYCLWFHPTTHFHSLKELREKHRLSRTTHQKHFRPYSLHNLIHTRLYGRHTRHSSRHSGRNIFARPLC